MAHRPNLCKVNAFFYINKILLKKVYCFVTKMAQKVKRVTMLHPLVYHVYLTPCKQALCQRLKVSMWRCFFSGNISSTVSRIPLSSTLPNSSFMAVPNIFMVGDRLI